MDLKHYEVKEREPVQGTFAGYDILSAPPPFSGITVLEMLMLAEKTNLGDSSGKSDYMKELGAITKLPIKTELLILGMESVPLRLNNYYPPFT